MSASPGVTPSTWWALSKVGYVLPEYRARASRCWSHDGVTRPLLMGVLCREVTLGFLEVQRVSHPSPANWLVLCRGLCVLRPETSPVGEAPRGRVFFFPLASEEERVGRARRAWEQRPAAGLGARGPCSMPSLPSCRLCPPTACASCGPCRLVHRCAAPVPATRTSSRAGPVWNLFCKTQSSVHIWGELGLRVCGEGLHLPEEPRARRKVAMRGSGPTQACCAGGEPLPPSAWGQGT